MSKQLNVDLRFNADVSGAKAQLQSLQQSVAQLTTSMATQGTQLGITPQLQQAQQAAVQLKTALQQSMNVETGKFDLSKFNSSLKSMNMDLSKLKTQLVNLGPSGQQTFMTLAQSIMTAEVPTKRISASLAALGTTLKNTAKWQLSSSMLHGFMSAVQTSYRYAQDLNESLNNIRIVTGESAAAMDKFAARANKAAKALSASTLDYTNAALIFYQQGLGDKEVEERTNVTVKLANVSKQSVEVASDQLTAIWNNFDDGTKSLEYYADVLTALGAATASSTDEIAGGLEKFAAVGETIGLSYEYAASALATITANTRQSEEVVGTALKTIFARIQGLKLGETLEDGVDLNKYSEALKTVDVDVLDQQTGELRNMDAILDDLGSKWQNLSKAQQTALAQTVAGVRQYTQFVSLMDNWDDGTSDSMMANLNTANNSTGALQEQADTYAESWEGASKRVKASLEEVYMDLLDDDFFIKITNGLADVLGLLDNFLDAMGGAKGLLSGLSSILLNIFAGSAAKGLENMVYNFRTFIGLTQKETAAMQAQIPALTQGLSGANPTSADIAQNTAFNSQITLNQTLLGMKEKLSEQDQLIAQGIIEQNQAYQQQLITLGQIKDATAQEQQNQKKNVMSSVIADAGYSADTGQQMINSINQDLELSDDLTKELMEIDAALEKGEADIDEYIAKLKELEKRAQDGDLKGTEKYLHARTTGVNGKQLSEAEMRRRATGAESNMSIYGKQDARNNVLSDEGRFKNLTRRDDIDPKAINKYTDATQDAIKANKNFEKGQIAVGEATKQAQNQILSLGNTTMSWSQTMVKVAQGAMSLSFAINSIKSLGTTWADENISVGEKLLQTFMSVGMALPMLMNGFTALGQGAQGYIGIMTKVQAKQAVMNSLQTATMGLHGQEIALINGKVTALTAEELAKKTGMSIDQAKLALTQTRIQLGMMELLQSEKQISDATKLNFAKGLGISLDNEEAAIKKINIILDALREGQTWKQALAQAGLNVADTISIKLLWEKIKANSVLIGQFIVMLGPVLAVAAAITALGLAVKLSIDHYNKEQKAAQEASETAREATKAYKEAQDAYEQFKNSASSYEEAVAGMASLTEGTIEYKEQLLKANEAALQLIQSQHLMYGENADYYYDKEGLIRFTEQGSQKANENAMNSLQKAGAYQTYATQRQKETKTEAELIKFNREELTGGVDIANAMGDMATFVAAGATLGSLVPVIGTAIGAVAGGVAGLIVATNTLGVSTSQEEKAMSLLASEYKKIGDGVLTEAKIREVLQDQVDSSVIEQLTEVAANNTTALREQLSALAENTAALKQSISQQVGAANQNNTAYQALNTEDKQTADAIVANRLQNMTPEDYYSMGFNKYSYTKEGTGGQYSMEGVKVLDYEKLRDGYLDARFGAEASQYKFENTGGSAAKLMKLDPNDGIYKEVSTKHDDVTYNEMLEFTGRQEAMTFQAQDNEILQKLNDFTSNFSVTDQEAKHDIEYSLAMGDDVDLSLLSPEDKEKMQKVLTEHANELGETYGTTYVEKLQTALDNYNPEDHAKRVEAEAKSVISQGAKDLELPEEALEAYTADLMKNNTALKDNKKLAAEAAVASAKFGTSLDTLEKVLKDNVKAINKEKDAVSKSLDYYEALGNVQKQLEETFGVEVDSDFVVENLDLIQKAAQNDLTAIEQLRSALMEEFVARIIVENGLDDSKVTEVMSTYNWLKDNMPDFSVTPTVDNGLFLQELNHMIAAAGMTVPQVNELLGSMGCSAVFASEPQEVTYREPDVTTTHVRKVSKGTSKGNKGEVIEDYDIIETKESTPGEEKTGFIEAFGLATAPIGEPVKVPKIESITKNPPPIKTNRVSSPTGNGGGSTPKAKKQEKPNLKDDSDRTKIEDEVEDYYYIKNVIEDLEREYDRASAAKDGMWGPDYITAMEKEITTLKKLRSANKQYKSELEGKLGTQKLKIQGLGAQLDADGRILNRNELVTKWAAEKDAVTVDKYNDYERQITDLKNQKTNLTDETDPDGSKAIAIEEDIEELEKIRDTEVQTAEETYEANIKSLENYEDTRDTLADTNDLLDEELRKIQQLNYEKIMKTVEFKIEIDDFALEILDSKIEALGDDLTTALEQIGYMKQKSNITFNSTKVNDYTDRTSQLVTAYNDPDEENRISRESYVQGLITNGQDIISEIQAAQQLDKEMREFYSNNLEKQLDNISEKASGFDHLVDSLDHYTNVLGLLGKGEDYETQNKFLQAKINTLTDSIEVSKQVQSTLKDQLAEAQTNYNNATTEKSKADWEKRINLITAKLQEEEQKYYGFIEQLQEAANQKRENSIRKEYRDREMESTNGLGYDTLLDSMERMDTLTNEYLTHTNKMYETNKILSQAQLAIDKTSNKQIQQKYKTYMGYIEELQKSGELTKSELATAEARYKVLEAEVALEEAKNTKSTVRLTRDAEGNFGYVYTADNDKVEGSMQNYLDAQNELYNLGLEQSNSYREKMMQLQKETHDAELQLQLDYANGIIKTEEELQRKTQLIRETSQALMTTYQEQFNQAQYTMATTQYSTLIKNDKEFYNGQVSDNKNSKDLMEIRDTEYYGGVKTEAEKTHAELESALGLHGIGMLDLTDEQYTALYESQQFFGKTTNEEADSFYSGAEGKYGAHWEKLKGLATGGRTSIDDVFNKDGDSLSHDIGTTFFNGLDTAYTNCETITEDWKDNSKLACEELGISVENLGDEFSADDKDALDDKIGTVETQSKNLREELIGEDGNGGLVKAMKDLLTTLMDEALAWELGETARDKYIEQLQDALTVIQDLIEEQRNFEPTLDQTITVTTVYKTIDETSSTPPANTPNTNNTNTGNTGNTGKTYTVKEGDTLWSIAQSKYGDGSKWGTLYEKNKGLIDSMAKESGLTKVNPKEGWWIFPGQELQYDTGGYTGEWGPEGRMAMLHEKEIVLNKEDTKNFLAATMVLREISQALDSNAQLASLGAFQLSATNLQNSPAEQVLQQEVTIHADFPNVTDHSEIEMAIDNLINAASQYANKQQ